MWPSVKPDISLRERRLSCTEAEPSRRRIPWRITGGESRRELQLQCFLRLFGINQHWLILALGCAARFRRSCCCGARWAAGFTAPGRLQAAGAWIHGSLEPSLALNSPLHAAAHCELTLGPGSPLPQQTQLECVRLQAADKERKKHRRHSKDEIGWENAQGENVLFFHSSWSALPVWRRIRPAK